MITYSDWVLQSEIFISSNEIIGDTVLRQKRRQIPQVQFLVHMTRNYSIEFTLQFFFLFNFLFFYFFFKFYFIFKLYNIVLVLPNIEMNPPQVYMCSPS